jgi:transcription antitermination factor NusG
MKGLGQVPDVGEEVAHWYCAVVGPNCHAKAEGELYERGYRTFVPKLRKWVSHAKTKKAVYRPLLGRYLFVEVDTKKQGFWQVRNARGIEGVVSSRGLEPIAEPIVIPAPVIFSLMQRQMRGEFDCVANESIPVGALVRIVEGEFENSLAVLTRRRKGKVEVKIAGTATNRSLYPMQVRPAA